jgi:hypothetical protein
MKGRPRPQTGGSAWSRHTVVTALQSNGAIEQSSRAIETGGAVMAVETTGGTSGLDEQILEPLRAGLRGDVIRPGDTQYDDARAIYNAMIDKRPAVIARCVDAGDVITAVNLGRDSGLRSPSWAAGTAAQGSA